MAKLYFRYGAMNSGKTTALIQVAYNYEETGQTATVLKPKIDTKGNEYVQSRIGVNRKVDYLIDQNDDLFEVIKNKFGDTHVVIVDEAQFITPKQVDQLCRVVGELHIPVLAYGLRTDFLGHVFPGSGRLLEIADVLEEIKTKCTLCAKRANFNSRREDGEFIKEGEQVLIDTSKTIEYVPLCTEHFIEKIGFEH